MNPQLVNLLAYAIDDGEANGGAESVDGITTQKWLVDVANHV
jgi:hypothetical protein